MILVIIIDRLVLMATIASENKPENIEDFKNWLRTHFKFDYGAYQHYYSVATSLLQKDFCNSQFWLKLGDELNNIDDEYKKATGYQLLAKTEMPEIYIKSLDSLLIKIFRKDILNNQFYPDPPETGWLNPDNWFTNVNDILRTTFIVKYLDGVEFILSKLSKIAAETSCKFNYSLEAREEGYYAAHAGVQIELDLVGKDFQPLKQIIKVELQVTTELQSIIKGLLHKYYEVNREKHRNNDYKWQWDYKCDEFASNYLGHIVHYVEGMIVEIRDKQNNKY